MVEVRGIARGGPRGALRRVRALRAALANAFAFTQLRTLTGFDPVHSQQKSRNPSAAALISNGGG